MDGAFGDQFALQRAHPLDEVVKSFQKGRVGYLLRADTRDSLSREPTALVVGIEDLKVASLDLDNQPEFLRKLELVTVVLRSAVDEIADVDRTGLHPRLEVVCTAHTNSGIDAKSIWAFGPQAEQAGSRRILNCLNVISRASYMRRRPDSVVPRFSRSLMASVA